MVSAPNNWQSIVGGIVGGISNDKRSAGLTGHNVTTDNPQTYGWIGQETSDLRQPIQKESSQNPSIPFTSGSPGVAMPYAQLLPNDIPTFLQQGAPGTNVSIRTEASSVGSPTLIPTGFAPINNAQFSGYGMSPQNGDHFKQYFANQIGLSNQLPKASPAVSAMAVQVEQSLGSAGSQDSWIHAWQTFTNMRKTYQPNQTYHG